MKKDDFTALPEEPARQGFYEVKLASGECLIAEWRQRSKKQGKVWWKYTSPDPTIEKQPELLEGVVAWRAAKQAAVDALLKRELTEAEKLDQAFEHEMRMWDLEDIADTLPPANRQLNIGDEVEIGSLKNCVVMGLRRDGQFVLIRYRDVGKKYGTPYDNGFAYGCWHWADVLPLATMQPTKLARSSIISGYLNSSLDSLISRYQHGLEDNPDYQRGHVWTDLDKERYIESLIHGRELGRFIFVKNPFPQKMHILDGKQRLTCIWQFVTSQIAYKGLYFHQLSRRDRNAIEGRGVQYADLPAKDYTRADLLRIFLEVNAGGVPQTEEHLQYVRDLLAAEEAANPPAEMREEEDRAED